MTTARSSAKQRQRLATDPEASAAAAGLRYVNDSAPGIRRRRCGRGFTYLDPGGERVSNGTVRQRIQALVLPPAWRDVWICPLADGHLQATGRDQRARKQYRYHSQWQTLRNQVKFDHVLDFAAALPHLRQTVSDDLKRPGLNRRKVIAAVVRLLELTLIRVGNDEYANANNSYGLTTLEGRHIDIDGAELRFEFIGKSGKQHQVRLRDRRLARIVRRCHELPGQRLFQYADGNSACPQTVDSGDVNDYLHQLSGRAFTAKDFRTWAATVAAGTALAERAARRKNRSTSAASDKRALAEVVKQVARQLGNTPAVCRRAYIHPTLVNAFLDHRLSLPRPRDRQTQGADCGLSHSEQAILDFLRRQ